MTHHYAIDDEVLFMVQGPQGREVQRKLHVYTIIARLPIEVDGRPRYRIKCPDEKVERVVTEEQISQLSGIR